MTKFIKLHEGQSQNIIYRDMEITGKPIIYVEEKANLCETDSLWEYGIGFLSSKRDESGIWGLMSPTSLINLWRALKCFEKLYEVDNNFSLAKCYEQGKSRIDMIPEDILTNMIKICDGHNVFVYYEELKYCLLPYIVDFIKRRTAVYEIYLAKSDKLEKQAFLDTTKGIKENKYNKKDRLDWHYITEFKGFFGKYKALKEKNKLQKEGYTIKCNGNEIFALMAYDESFNSLSLSRV